VRVLGVEKFGLVSFAAAFISYFVLITDYGFNLSAVREISIHRTDKQRLSKIISSVYAVKILLFVISILIFTILLFSFQRFSKESELYIASFIFTFGSLIMPTYFFQGIENTKSIALVTFIVKLIWVASIFAIVTSPSDYVLLAYFNSISWFAIGCLLFFLMVFRYKIKLVVPGLSQLKEQFREGGVLFLSNISVNLYTTSNIFILGLLTNNTVVGYFSAADKIRLAVQAFFNPLTQALYPHLSNLFNTDRARAHRFIIRSLKSVGLLSFMISSLLFFFSKEIVIILLGYEYLNSVNVLRIISFLPFIIYLSNLFGIQTILNLGRSKVFTSIISSAALLSLMMGFILMPVYKEIGASITMLITELFVTISIILYLIKKGFFLEKEI
jgi:PST family polysaccharide transporter